MLAAKSIFLIIVILAAKVTGNLVLKTGMARFRLAGDPPLWRTGGRPFFYAALACFGTEFLLYAYLLSSVSLVVAYPILVSLGYLAIIGLSKALLRETFRAVNWLGAVAIIAGVLLVGMR
jgi:multidrug transporter EmrE-like cation transporter